jgi:hypothetical protein
MRRAHLYLSGLVTIYSSVLVLRARTSFERSCLERLKGLFVRGSWLDLGADLVSLDMIVCKLTILGG